MNAKRLPALFALLPVMALVAACASEMPVPPETSDTDTDTAQAADADDPAEKIGASTQELQGKASVIVCKALPHGHFTRVLVNQTAAHQLLSHGWQLPDCLGVCGGTAVPDCVGVCNGNNVCTCTEGQMRCAAHGTHFERCSQGSWIGAECPPGTACKQESNGSILCDQSSAQLP